VGGLIAFGMLILILRIFVDNVIKLKIEKEYYVEAGKAVNLANQILNSNLTVYDKNNQARKGILNKTKLVEIEKEKPMEFCDYIDYDYSIQIVGDNKYNIGYDMKHLKELFSKGKKCGAIYENEIKNYKFPLIIQDDNGKKETAFMYLSLVKTPLSIISKELNIACNKDFYENIIVAFGFNKDDLKISKNGDYFDFCIKTFKGYEMCKKIKCEKTIEIIDLSKCKNYDGKCPRICNYVLDRDCHVDTCSNIKIRSSEKEVKICFWATKKESELC
jgi:hypothetical protein